jgi:xanthine dehydrogenase YagR molybdenum-binding subunit
MKFETPATANPIDQLKVVGKPTDRIDGPLKTTGAAPYAYDRHDAVPNQAYGYVIGAGIAKGRIASMDLTKAKAAAGVLAIVTAENAGKLGKGTYNTAKLLGGPEVDHYHQTIAVVVAETFEQARAAANLVRVNYVRVEGKYDLAAAKDTASKPEKMNRGAAGYIGGRLRRCIHGGAGPTRCNLHHPGSGTRDDGTARVDCRLGRGQTHAVDFQSDDRLERG